MTEHLVADTPVTHPELGAGVVLVDNGQTVIVRFGGDIHQVLRPSLTVVPSLTQAIERGEVDGSADTLLNAMALSIRSINDQWGVFSRSRVQLLPHQLWVCHRVSRSWPFRWLVADDVGLGKTIEAGLVLMPQIASGRIRRLLILAPAKLVPQWQQRMREMFDIRLQIYDRAVDSEKVNFWDTANFVVASIHTLRREVAEGRSSASRFLDADQWDAVVVDEAHHLNADERMGETLSFQLIRAMEERQRIASLLLFTGTPHRGKDFGFISLLSLLRPDTFEPGEDMEAQLEMLPEVMIRNNKATVTDLSGNKLFTPVSVATREYQFSELEETFYRTLSEFIIDGRAYASSLDGRAQSARMLVLITLQKLAASSIAAIRSALQKRRTKLADTAAIAREAANQIQDEDDLDSRAERDERAPFEFLAELMEGEIDRLDDLIALAEPIVREHKIERLVGLIQEELPEDEPVLLFTEYKATQALVVDALHDRFGYGCCAFINGDERLESVRHPDGSHGPKSWPRDAAAAAFNSGSVRFLVSTEAAGEGIDLQERCATLIHVDMPWNPMRLHQRVGRLSRYGQKRPVQVYILRNPDTVEARIWDLLSAKLERIQLALSEAMDDQEDIGQLVIGMTGSAYFEKLFADGQCQAGEGLNGWFDQETATIEGEDIVSRVKSMLGNVARFDFGQVGQNLPKVDLPDLERFFALTMEVAGRRVFKRSDGIEVKTPIEWSEADYALADRYEGLVFDRNADLGKKGATRLVGIGHRLFDKVLERGLALPGTVTRCLGLEQPLLVISIDDEVTGHGHSVTRVVAGVTRSGDGSFAVLRDWELLQRLNELTRVDTPDNIGSSTTELRELERDMLNVLEPALPKVADMMVRPKARSVALVLPPTNDFLRR